MSKSFNSDSECSAFNKMAVTNEPVFNFLSVTSPHLLTKMPNLTCGHLDFFFKFPRAETPETPFLRKVGELREAKGTK